GNQADIENADLVIIPGSKNTVKDLMLLKEHGLDSSIKRAYAKGVSIIGVCGGYQMLGKHLYDPYCVESSHRECKGIGLLEIETTFGREKTTCRVEAKLVDGSLFTVRSANGKAAGYGLMKGYEIHMGESEGDIGLFRLKRLSPGGGTVLDGSKNKNCWGTYIHGVFENDKLRRSLINSIRTRKGLPEARSSYRYSEAKEKAIDKLAAVVKDNLDMAFIRKAVGL
ncbi:MAG TPA: hypothetical protein VF790_07400, partial [Dissulfurispiraceae bacterium]